jgi:hypothetical protein
MKQCVSYVIVWPEIMIVLPILGSSARPPYHIDLGIAIWTLHPTVVIPFHRFLRSLVCPDQVSGDRSEKGLNVCLSSIF